MIYQEDLIFSVVSVGNVLHKKGSFSVKARPYAAFALRLKGHVTFEAEGKTFSSHAGDVTFIPDGMPYKAEYTVGESIVIHLSGCNYHACENISVSAFPYLKECFEKMATAWKERKTNEVKSLFYHLLAWMEEGKKRETDASFEACLSYLETHFKDPSVTLGAVARAGFISESTLRRKFVQNLGIPPKEHLIRLRLAFAIGLLYEGATVSQAAKDSGFSDEKFFARTVKARYGIPPSAFRYV